MSDAAPGRDGTAAGPQDPAPGEPGPDAGPRTSRRRTRRRRILRRTAAGFAVVLLAAAGGAYALYRDVSGGVTRKDVDRQLGTNRPVKLNKSLNILMLGSDSRAGENSRYGAEAGARSDTAMLLHLSPNRDQAIGISFPRDSMVRIPECEKDDGQTVQGRFGMINSAFAYAGPTCTWKTLETLTDIHIDHFVQIDFAGFKRVVDALGGVEICVDQPVNDPRAELRLPAGKQVVKGEQALGYVRARYTLGNGSDLERIERQQKFMAAVVNEAAGTSLLTDPVKTYSFLKAVGQSVTTDDDLDLGTMKRLADSLKGISAGQVRFVTVPVERYAPDPNRVQWNQTGARALFEAIRNDDDLPAAPAASPAQPAPPKPSQIRVAVTDAGAGGRTVARVVARLRQEGFKVDGEVAHAAASPISRISFTAAAEAQASTLARIVPNAELTVTPDAPADGVRLVLGSRRVRLAPAINKIGGGGVRGGRSACG